MSAIDKGAFLRFGFSCFGTTREVDGAQVQVTACKDGAAVPEQAVRVTKKLLESKAAKDIVKGDGKCRARLKSLGFAYAEGCIFMPLGVVERAIDIIESWKPVRERMVLDLADDLPNIIADDAKRLGPMFDRADYPSREKFVEAWKVRANFEQIGEPAALGAISTALLDKQREVFKSEMQDTAAEWRSSMRQAFAALIESLRERLDGERDGGKPKIFRDSRVESLKEWISLFDAKNISEDNELADLVGKARTLLEGTNADDLREDASLRKWAANQLGQIKEAAATLVTADAPRRKFRLDDEAA